MEEREISPSPARKSGYSSVPWLVPWEFGETLLALITGILLSSFPGLFLPAGTDAITEELLAYGFQVAGFALTPVLFLRLKYRLPLSVLGLRRPNGKMLLLGGVVAGVGLYLLNLLLTTSLTMLLPDSWVQDQSILLLLGRVERPLDAGFLILCILVLSPFAEELLFRSFMYPALRKLLPARGAILISAAIFAALHLNLLAFLPLFVGGIGFNLIYEKYHNLFCNAVAHVLWNGLSLLLYFTTA